MTVIKIKSDTTVNLTGTTPAQREILHDSTTNSLYLGDGTTTFASLTSVSGGGGGGGGITSLAQDTTPQLGGDLDAQSNDISSVGTITATSIVKSGGASSEFLKADGSVDTSTYLTGHPSVSAAGSSNSNTGNTFIQNLTIDTNGHITALTTATASAGGGGGIGNVVEDTTPQLGGNLDAQSNDISSVGTITATSLVKSGGASSEFLKADGSVDTSTYLTSETSHSDVLVDGDFSSQGIMLRGGSAGTYSILTDNSSNWNTAYGWGDHGAGGYATTSVTTLSSLSITKSQISDLNTLTSHKLVDGAYTFPSALDSSSNKALFSDGSSAVEFATAPKSDISGITGTVSGVYNIVILDQTTYNNITTKDPNTIYFVPS